MSGKLPIDRVREAQDAPAVYEEHRERFTRKQAALEQTDQLAEGERPPEPGAASSAEPAEPKDEDAEDTAKQRR